MLFSLSDVLKWQLIIFLPALLFFFLAFQNCTVIGYVCYHHMSKFGIFTKRGSLVPKNCNEKCFAIQNFVRFTTHS